MQVRAGCNTFHSLVSTSNREGRARMCGIRRNNGGVHRVLTPKVPLFGKINRNSRGGHAPQQICPQNQMKKKEQKEKFIQICFQRQK